MVGVFRSMGVGEYVKGSAKRKGMQTLVRRVKNLRRAT